MIKKTNGQNQQLVSSKEEKLMRKTTKGRKGYCYFCSKKRKEENGVCAYCRREEGNQYCPMEIGSCRICNRLVIIATGYQPLHKKQGYCTLRCAGEWTQGTSDAMPYQEMMMYG